MLPVEYPRVLYTGSGTRGPFSLSVSGTPITYADASEIIVVRYDADGDGTLQINGVHYDLSAESVLPDITDPDRAATAATLTLRAAQSVLSSSQRLLIYRYTSPDQGLALNRVTGFNSAAAERQLDVMSRQIQELFILMNRVLVAHPTDSDVFARNIPRIADRSGKLFSWDDDGNPEAMDPEEFIGVLNDLVPTGFFATGNNLSEGNAATMRANLGIDDPALEYLALGTATQNTAGMQAFADATTPFGLYSEDYEVDDVVTLDFTANAIGIPPRAVINQAANDKRLFDITDDKVRLHNLFLDHIGNGSQNLIRFQRGNLQGDVDATLEGVTLNGKSDGSTSLVYMNGRGLIVHRGHASQGSACVYELDWNGLTETDSDAAHGPLNGFRRFIFSNMLTHGESSGLLSVKNRGTNAHNIQSVLINGWLHDIGGRLYDGNPNMSLIADFIINNSTLSTGGIPLVFAGGTSSRQARGFSIGPGIVNGNRDSASDCPVNAIKFEAGYYKGLNVLLSTSLIGRSVISIVGDTAATTIIEDAVFIVSAAECGTDAGARRWLEASNVTLRRCKFIGNFSKHANNTATGIVHLDTVILDDCDFTGLTYDQSSLSLLTSTSTYTDNGGNKFGNARVAYTIATLPVVSFAGEVAQVTDLGGGAGFVMGSAPGGVWQVVSKQHQTKTTAIAWTWRTLRDAESILLTGTLAADRTITLDTTNAYPGARVRVTRTGAGAFNWSLNGLKNLATNTWAEATYDGSAWFLSAYGAL